MSEEVEVNKKKTGRRSPLQKEKFLEGNRQKWTGILMLYSLVMVSLQIKFAVNPEPYMQFMLTIGSLFILGGSVDSFLKIKAEKESNTTEEK
jgi:hypothetical protein